MPDNETRAHSSVDSGVGRRLTMARWAAKLTPAQLGAELGRSARRIERLEAGEIPVSASLLYSISKIVDKPISWFYQDVTWGNDGSDDNLYNECLALLELLRASSSLNGIRDVLKLAVNSE